MATVLFNSSTEVRVPNGGRPRPKRILLRERCVDYVVLARMAARLLVTAWKPDLMLVTEQREPHVSH